jgi:hypothetical protein
MDKESSEEPRTLLKDRIFRDESSILDSLDTTFDISMLDDRWAR